MVQTVGIMSPADMGGGIGAMLRSHGLRVVAALDERSARTRELSAAAGIEDVGSVERLVSESDLVLSVLVPSQAVAAAERAAKAMREAGRTPLFADCNAISPQTTEKVGDIVGEAGARYVDASIIGPPPRKPGTTRIYASGQHANELAVLNDFGLDIRVLGDRVGQASGIKMCYAALTKGLSALATELLVSARRMGLEEPLRAELEGSQSKLLEQITRAVPGMPPKAHRWIGEMEEIASTFEHLGLTPKILLGAADMYTSIAKTALGKETPETRDRERSLDEIVDALAEEMKPV